MAWRVGAAAVRDKLTTCSPDGSFWSVAAVAAAYGIPYRHVRRLRGPQFQAVLDSYPADVIVSMSCPQIIGRRVRRRFPAGALNVHGAPLPRYRGLMPAFWAMLNGETETAVTVHFMADKVDAGEIVLQRPVPIDPGDTWDTLVRKSKA
ncbi:MAG TPA: hypothetical protein EYP56_17875, partial [Planctomycetaceae bacterium]|nr:hypothetical protein [Planctomycetaceae bacterium]